MNIQLDRLYSFNCSYFYVFCKKDNYIYYVYLNYLFKDNCDGYFTLVIEHLSEKNFTKSIEFGDAFVITEPAKTAQVNLFFKKIGIDIDKIKKHILCT